MENAIEVKNLSKKFTLTLKRSLLYGTIDLFKSFLGVSPNSDQLRKDEFWALKDINFSIAKGEILGIIGVNGSGKSTLLRVLTGIYPPDTGEVKINGKVGGLIAVGAGFHPHMTGRENVYLNGALLGMNKDEIDEKFDDIVEFSEVGEFLDAPVSNYSSGMKVRLGFAIAINVKPEILLIDEVLSVGDLSFRNKSLKRMAELRDKANAIIYISHNLEQVRLLCTRVLILDRGTVLFDGDVQEGIVRYEELTRERRMASADREFSRSKFKKGVSSEDIDISSVALVNGEGDPVRAVEFTKPLGFVCDFETTKKFEGLYFSFSIHNDNTQNIIWKVSNDQESPFDTGEIQEGKNRIQVTIPNHNLNPGVYRFFLAIRNSVTGETYERFFSDSTFTIKSDGKKLEKGIVNSDVSWDLERIE